MDENPTNANEQYSLGTDYRLKDNGQAIYWLTKAAEQGHIDAQYYLGVIYDHGECGALKNKRKAKYWYAKAADQGDVYAKSSLDTLNAASSSGGCYVATCIYGSYDCPEVWTLRRYRDFKLSNTWFGRQFIRIYYTISPKIVELFGNKKWLNGLWKPILNSFVCKLQNNGIDSSPYSDK